MPRTALLAAALLAVLPLAAPAVVASHWSCATTDPIPPSPVGGVVGQVYTFTTDTAWGGAVFAFGLACSALDQGVHTVNAQCVWLIGRPCLP